MFSPLASIPEQLPARMLNEYAYCPRLFYLEYVQQEFRHSADTLDGRFVHRRVDQEKGALPAAAELAELPKLHARSVMVGSDRLGAIARIDLIETDQGRVIPIDYKRGAGPDPARVPEGAYEPERVQVCLQGLLLREEGYEVRSLPSVWRALPKTLRNNNFCITAVIVGDELIAVEPGDTTDKLYGLSLDIGTTTVVGAVVNLTSGAVEAVQSTLNGQASFGADVISRVSHTMMEADGLATLKQEIEAKQGRCACAIGDVRVIDRIVLSIFCVSFRSNSVSTSSDTPSPTISPALLHPQLPSDWRYAWHPSATSWRPRE